jgi:uncharacterized cupredoxin-like copper-binding protein
MVIVFVGLFLSGCAAADNKEAAISSGEVVVNASEWKFDPSSIRVEAGKPVKLVLANSGKTEHNIIVPETVAGGNLMHLVAKAGESASIEFTPDKVGVYEVACTLPGHKESGMTARIEVVGGQ